MNNIRPDANGFFPVIPRFSLTRVALGNLTAYEIMVTPLPTASGRDELFVAIQGRGAYTFGGHTHFGYVMEKIGIGENDARHVADFINDQKIGGQADKVRYGNYERYR